MHEIVLRLPVIVQCGKLVVGCRHCPFISEAFSVNVQVWAGNFLAIGIAMGWSSDVQPHEHHDLPPAVLKREFREIDSPRMNVEHERLAPVLRQKRNDRRLLQQREVSFHIVCVHFRHGDESRPPAFVIGRGPGAATSSHTSRKVCRDASCDYCDSFTTANSSADSSNFALSEVSRLTVCSDVPRILPSLILIRPSSPLLVSNRNCSARLWIGSFRTGSPCFGSPMTCQSASQRSLRPRSWHAFSKSTRCLTGIRPTR